MLLVRRGLLVLLVLLMEQQLLVLAPLAPLGISFLVPFRSSMPIAPLVLLMLLVLLAPLAMVPLALATLVLFLFALLFAAVSCLACRPMACARDRERSFSQALNVYRTQSETIVGGACPMCFVRRYREDSTENRGHFQKYCHARGE